MCYSSCRTSVLRIRGEFEHICTRRSVSNKGLSRRVISDHVDRYFDAEQTPSGGGKLIVQGEILCTLILSICALPNDVSPIVVLCRLQWLTFCMIIFVLGSFSSFRALYEHSAQLLFNGGA